MRPLIVILVVLDLMLAAPAALAAPTCLNKSGDTVRCEAAGAMPVGWTPSPQQLLIWQKSRPPGPSTGDIVKVFCTVGLLLALIALMPEFDGTQAEDWDAQEDDDKE